MLNDTSFWVAAVFLLVVALLYKRVMAIVTTSLDERADMIRSQIEDARKLREDAQALLANYQRQQLTAMDEAEQIISAAKEEAVRLKQQAEKNMEETVERRKLQALSRIAQSEAQALMEVRNTAIELAIAATENLISEHLVDSQKTDLVNLSINQLSDNSN